MSITTKITLSCGNKDCSAKHVVEGANATRAQLYKASKKEGWQWKSAEVQFCPKHKSVKIASVKKAVKKAAKPSPKKAVKKASPVKAEKPVTKPSPVWSPAPSSSGE